MEEYERSRCWGRITLARPAPRSAALVQLWKVALPGLSLPSRTIEQVADVVVGDVVMRGAYRRAVSAVGRCLHYGLSRYDPLERRNGVGASILGALRVKVGQGEGARVLACGDAGADVEVGQAEGEGARYFERQT